jgi:small subunit ribosomal protein S20
MGRMATHKSAIKRHRQDVKRRTANRLHKTRVRTAIKHCRAAITEGDAEKAQSLLTGTLALLDRTSRTGALHDNTVARSKSRLQRAVNKTLAKA